MINEIEQLRADLAWAREKTKAVEALHETARAERDALRVAAREAMGALSMVQRFLAGSPFAPTPSDAGVALRYAIAALAAVVKEPNQ